MGDVGADYLSAVAFDQVLQSLRREVGVSQEELSYRAEVDRPILWLVCALAADRPARCRAAYLRRAD